MTPEHILGPHHLTVAPRETSRSWGPLNLPKPGTAHRIVETQQDGVHLCHLPLIVPDTWATLDATEL